MKPFTTFRKRMLGLPYCESKTVMVLVAGAHVAGAHRADRGLHFALHLSPGVS